MFQNNPSMIEVLKIRDKIDSIKLNTSKLLDDNILFETGFYSDVLPLRKLEWLFISGNIKY